LNGPTTGPKTSRGEIGRQLNACETLPVVDFKPIKIPKYLCQTKMLSAQTTIFLYSMCRGVSNGSIDATLANKNPVPFLILDCSPQQL
jgi:hypothetical protein